MLVLRRAVEWLTLLERRRREFQSEKIRRTVSQKQFGRPDRVAEQRGTDRNRLAVGRVGTRSVALKQSLQNVDLIERQSGQIGQRAVQGLRAWDVCWSLGGDVETRGPDIVRDIEITQIELSVAGGADDDSSCSNELMALIALTNV